MENVIGIMAMIYGFIALHMANIPAAYCCFGFAFILWCVSAVYEYINAKKAKEVDHG